MPRILPVWSLWNTQVEVWGWSLHLHHLLKNLSSESSTVLMSANLFACAQEILCTECKVCCVSAECIFYTCASGRIDSWNLWVYIAHLRPFFKVKSFCSYRQQLLHILSGYPSCTENRQSGPILDQTTIVQIPEQHNSVKNEDTCCLLLLPTARTSTNMSCCDSDFRSKILYIKYCRSFDADRILQTQKPSVRDERHSSEEALAVNTCSTGCFSARSNNAISRRSSLIFKIIQVTTLSQPLSVFSHLSTFAFYPFLRSLHRFPRDQELPGSVQRWIF